MIKKCDIYQNKFNIFDANVISYSTDIKKEIKIKVQ